ncbi:MAG: cyanophycin synthetase, partial [Candidatus Uhrbacteria bacterium]|nr:cyanophycin synthetase [Candidatus Uhrbacteria bacterium]
GYVNAKLNITKSQTKEDIFFYHPNYEELVNAAQNTKAYTEAFPEVKDLIRGHLPLLGEHNIENARAVFAVTRKLNIDDSDVQVAMESFKPLAHRLEEIGEVNGILFVNDSISTTPESAIAAVNVYADRLGAIILGGEDRGYKFDALADRLSEIGDVFVYIMPGGERICESMTRHNISYIPISTIDEAVKLAAGALSEGSVCLLSPASPSYNQFKNFEERGHAFRLAVQNLA